MTCTKCHGLAVAERVPVETIMIDYLHCLNCGQWSEQEHTPVGIPDDGRRHQVGWRSPAKIEEIEA